MAVMKFLLCALLAGTSVLAAPASLEKRQEDPANPCGNPLGPQNMWCMCGSQLGGWNWGCAQGFCVQKDEYYSQCRPDNSPFSKLVKRQDPEAERCDPAKGPVPMWCRCAAEIVGFSAPCGEGVCVRHDEYYSQCRPDPTPFKLVKRDAEPEAEAAPVAVAAPAPAAELEKRQDPEAERCDPAKGPVPMWCRCAAEIVGFNVPCGEGVCVRHDEYYSQCRPDATPF